jgi:hypothetical protein
VGDRSGIPSVSTDKTCDKKIDERIGIPLERLLDCVFSYYKKLFFFYDNI